MITRKQFMKFCENHKIKHDENAILSSNCHYFVKYNDVKDPNLDKSLVNPSVTFIRICFTNRDYDETNFLYKPFKNVYDESCVVNGEKWYNFYTHGQMTVPLPLHLYDKNAYNRFFTLKELSYKNTLNTTIPFNTIEQLEHLYTVVYPKLNKDIKVFYNSEDFQNNLQTIKNLKKCKMDLVNKFYNITKKKAEIEDEFTI